MNRIVCAVIVAVVGLGVAPGAVAFIESRTVSPERYTLAWVRQHAWIAVFKVDRVDADRGIVVYELTEQLQGHRRVPDKECPKRMRHLVKLNGKVPADLDKIQAGQVAICFGEHQHKLFVTYVQDSWYVAQADRDEPSFGRIIWQRPDLNCLFVGPAADLADAFRELAAGREVIVRCQKGTKEPATQFGRCRPEKKEQREPARREPVPALQAVADTLPSPSPLGGEGRVRGAADPKKAVPALVNALRSDDPLVRTTAAKLLKEIDPEAAKKAGER